MRAPTLFLILTAITPVFPQDLDKFLVQRNELLQKEEDMALGSDIQLSDNEELANEIIMQLKLKELDYGFDNPSYFNLSKHFFEYKDIVKQSQLFKILKAMPKGAVLHAHDTGLLSPDYVVSLTYLDNLFVCFYGKDVSFLFSKETPRQPCLTQWQLMRDARFSSGNVEKFDAELKKHFSIVIDEPQIEYTNINIVWSRFQDYFIKSSAIFCYKPVWEKYFYDTLKALREDNVMYFEVRSVLPPLYDLDGNVYDSVVTAESYSKVTKQFVEDYPDFYGAKLIYAPLRMVNDQTVEGYIKIAKILKKKLPTFFAGFDLVGQEDLGRPTRDFLPILLEAADELDYFFHAGETNWSGMSSDENLVDAILLGTKRLGHAFALVKHPVLLQEVSKRDIAIEVNVVSNAVLKLVSDVRNHPLATFLANDLPVVISSDDPGIWEAEPLTHDFYVSFVGVASLHADLKMLKKLALNSLYYSSISDKDKILHEFEIRWTKFIDALVKDRLSL